MTALLPGLTQSSTHADLSASMSMSMWGVAADQCQPFTEKHNLASLRYQLSGTREVVVACVSDVRAFLITHKGVDRKLVTPNRCATFLKTMDKASVEMFARQFSLFYATVGPGDFMYTPCMFACVERVGRSNDAIGAVVRGLYKTDSKAKDFLDDLAKFYAEINAAAPLIAATQAVVESATAAMTPV